MASYSARNQPLLFSCSFSIAARAAQSYCWVATHGRITLPFLRPCDRKLGLFFFLSFFIFDFRHTVDIEARILRTLKSPDFALLTPRTNANPTQVHAHRRFSRFFIIYFFFCRPERPFVADAGMEIATLLTGLLKNRKLRLCRRWPLPIF